MRRRDVISAPSLSLPRLRGRAGWGSRRAFISLLGVAATGALPLPLSAQQPERMRRVGILTGVANDAEGQTRIAAFRQALRARGWIEGRNVQIDERWAAGETANVQAHAVELVNLKPDVILGTGSRVWNALRRQTESIPIVNVGVAMTHQSNLARPGGNVTGFTIFEQSLIGKLLGTLKEAAPRVTRVVMLIHPDHLSLIEYSNYFETAAASLEIKPIVARVRDRGGIQRSLDELAQEPDGAVIMPPDVFVVAHRDLLLALAARHRLPFVSPYRALAVSGGLMSYGPDFPDVYRRAAGYADRILKGEKASDLPVQTPTKFALVVNLKTAKALGLTMPLSLLARADEVIE